MNVKNIELNLKINELTLKEKELKKLKSRNIFDLIKDEKLISIFITSLDENIQYNIICKKTEQFEEIENKLYNEYPQYRKTSNIFIFNGIRINKYKTLEENKINNNAIIILEVID